MKPLVKEPSPSVYSNEAHPTKQSQGDPESGAHTITSSNGDARTTDHCFPWWRTNLNSIRMVLAEMIGTFILMFCVCGIIAGRELTKGDMGLLEYAATGGLSVTILMFCVGPISGGHLNPSVTIAFATVGHFPWSKVPLYISAQMLGSVFATYVGESVYGIKADILTTRPLQSRATAFWAELMATSITLFLASSLCHQAHAVAQASGFVVGIAIALAVLITGPVSGGSLNPARSFGPAVVSWRFNDLWLYLFAPTVGAVAGALLFKVLRLQHPPSSSPSSSNASPPAKGLC